jgi:hypothetical protein
MRENQSSAKFRLGHLVSTPNALSQLQQEDILKGIQLHQAGDWGMSMNTTAKLMIGH